MVMHFVSLLQQEEQKDDHERKFFTNTQQQITILFSFLLTLENLQEIQEKFDVTSMVDHTQNDFPLVNT